MGEYGNYNGRRIKIGTCDSMYYLRYDQKNLVMPEACSLDAARAKNLRYRIPALEEDGLEPGDFEFGTLVDSFGPLRSIKLRNIDGDFEGLTKDKGIVQMKNEHMGLLMNAECLHGISLPENKDGKSYFFNGHRDVLYMQALKNADDDMYIIIACACCGKAWRTIFGEIYQHISSLRMLLRLWKQVNDYRVNELGVSQTYVIDDWSYRDLRPADDFECSHRSDDWEYHITAAMTIDNGKWMYNLEFFTKKNGVTVANGKRSTYDFEEFEKMCAEVAQREYEWNEHAYQRPEAYRPKKIKVEVEGDTLSMIKGVVRCYLDGKEFRTSLREGGITKDDARKLCDFINEEYSMFNLE